MKRYSKTFLTSALLCASVTALASGFSLTVSQSTNKIKEPKNFIVIFADDLGYADIGCYRNLFPGNDDRSLSSNHTPNIDKLGEEGVRFMQGYANAWCAPSRQTLLSGRWCNRADNINRPWVGKQLRTLGYRTCFIGKSHGKNSTEKVMNSDPATAEFDDGLFFDGGERKYYLRPGEEFPSYVNFVQQPFVAAGGESQAGLASDSAARARLVEQLRQADGLRRGMLLREILGPPIALR